MQTATRHRVFLTGATGTVGRGVLAALIEDGNYDVMGLVRRPADGMALADLGVQGVVGDMTDRACFEQLRATHAFDFIVHAAQASYHNHSREEIDRWERMAVDNLERLACPATRLLIFTGGIWSYGTGADGGRINEQTPQRPFAAARERADLVREIRTRRSNPWLILDPPSLVYGRSGPLQTIAGALRTGAAIDVLDDSRVLWSVVEQNDLGRAYVAMLRHGRAGDSFVVAEDEPVVVRDLYETIARQVGAGRIVRCPPSAFAHADEDDQVRRQTSQPVDAALVRARTGWRPRERFVTSFPRFLA